MSKTPCFAAFGVCHFTDGCDHGTCRMQTHARPAPVMRATEGLRFVERTQEQGNGTARTVRVLQQAWAPVYGGQIEWHDVPLVTE